MTKQLTLRKAFNPRYANRENTAILIDTVFDELGDQAHQFLAKPDDVEEHGVNLYCRAATGEFGDIAPYKEESKKNELSMVKNELVQQLEQELFRRLPVLKVFRHGAQAVEAATTVEEARAAFKKVKWE